MTPPSPDLAFRDSDTGEQQAAGLTHSYLAGHDPANPVASPLFADLKGLVPIRVHVGDDEVLLTDSVRFVESAIAAGVDARLDVWEGMMDLSGAWDASRLPRPFK